MTNALRMTLGLMAAIAMIGCQKNADKLGTSVRGRASSVAGGSTAAAYTTNYNTQISNAQPVINLLNSEVGQTGYQNPQGVVTTLRMCGSVGVSSAQTLTPFSAPKAQMEIDVYDQLSPSTGAIVTKLPFLSGYMQQSGQYTYVTAEFGDGSGNIAFAGYVDAALNMVSATAYSDTFGVDGGLVPFGTFSISGQAWDTACAQ